MHNIPLPRVRSGKKIGIHEILWLAMKKFLLIEGPQRAEAFAFNAYFSLFPLVILLVTVTSFFVDRDRAGKEVIAYMESYVPLSNEMRHHIVNSIAGVISARGRVSAVALLILVWAALQSFSTLICATNRAWGVEVHNWWRLPLRSLVLLGSTVAAILLGMVAPLLVKMVREGFFPVQDFRSWVYALGSFAIPWLVVFLSLSLFYKLAPRRPTRFTEIWGSALLATVFLKAAESLFVIYLKQIGPVNAVYGVFGGIMALLLWIYLSGSIFIFGACLCAVRADGRTVKKKAMVP